LTFVVRLAVDAAKVEVSIPLRLATEGGAGIAIGVSPNSLV
jgi:hypothetical protein